VLAAAAAAAETLLGGNSTLDAQSTDALRAAVQAHAEAALEAPIGLFLNARDRVNDSLTERAAVLLLNALYLAPRPKALSAFLFHFGGWAVPEADAHVACAGPLAWLFLR
jgi:hypothetical protein